MGFLFRQAKPVWESGKTREMNYSLGFWGTFEWELGEEQQESERTVPELRITGASVYRVYLNGNMIFHGPARAAHDYYRVDRILLPAQYLKRKNSIAVEVVSFCISSFYTLNQPGFLQAEVIWLNNVLLSTQASKADGNIFKAKHISERIQKVQRYSYQRVFTEAYRLSEDSSSWIEKGICPKDQSLLCETEEKRLLERHVSYSKFPVKHAEQFWAQGTFGIDPEAKIWEDRSYLGIDKEYEGYPVEELEVFLSPRLDKMKTKRMEKREEKFQFKKAVTLSEGEFGLFDMGYNTTGFMGTDLICEQDCTIVYVFDEVLTQEDICYNRMCCVNGIYYELKKGAHTVETIQPYTGRYGKWMVLKGKIHIRDIWVREYINPDSDNGAFSCSDEIVNHVFEAARRTFSQNAVDIYMDCPSRERAGWLCDSFFTARVEAILTGNTSVEDNFLENFCLAEKFPGIPDGMLPMCYPADHPLGEYIPNWALWMILELFEYHQRKPDEKIHDRIRDKIWKLLKLFEKYENSDGLLENLDGWVFVEWSRANALTDGVNYPSNMLYSAALRAAGVLYGSEEWKEKGRKIADVICSQAYRNGFFIDHAVREKGKLIFIQESTEVCQYYAFFMKIATPVRYSELFDVLCEKFGPGRNSKECYPEIAPANAFIGNYLRIEMLSQNMRTNQVLQETRDFFAYMADRTGTLWEHDGAFASCNHGFASHIIATCYRDILGVESIDHGRKRIILCMKEQQIADCYGALKVESQYFKIKWAQEGAIRYLDYQAPEGYEVHVVNRCGKEIKHKSLL